MAAAQVNLSMPFGTGLDQSCELTPYLREGLALCILGNQTTFCTRHSPSLKLSFPTYKIKEHFHSISFTDELWGPSIVNLCLAPRSHGIWGGWCWRQRVFLCPGWLPTLLPEVLIFFFLFLFLFQNTKRENHKIKINKCLIKCLHNGMLYKHH